MTRKGVTVTRIKTTKYFGTLFNKWKILAIFCRPFWVKRNIDIFKNTEFLNVVGVEVTYCFKNSIFNPTSLNSNKLIIHIVYYLYYYYETFYDKDLWPEVLWINIIEKWDFCHLFEIKEMLHTDRFSSGNYSINWFFSIYFPRGSFWFVWAYPTYTLF